MDSITQAALGAAIGEELLGSESRFKGALVRADHQDARALRKIDLDVVLYLFYDKFDMLSIHRGFSHSIAFSILGAFIMAFILSRISTFKGTGFLRLLLFAWLTLFTHILLDTFTTYGTQLLLPFSDARLGLDSINVIDPVYTVPLLIGLLISLSKLKLKNKKWGNRIGLLVSSAYLLLTLAHKQSVDRHVSMTFENEGIIYEELRTIPVGVANINWYGMARSADSIYLTKHMAGCPKGEIEAFPINDNFLKAVDPDIAVKMKWMAKGFYTVERSNESIRVYNLQIDMRGVVKTDNIKAPTRGYFEISHLDGEWILDSGSH